MATNRTIAELLYLFRDGQAAKTITPTDFEDLIQSLHPSTGTFIDLPGSPGSLAVGRLWQNDGIVQVSLGGGPAALATSFAGQGTGSFAATARQRMRASRTLNGSGLFVANATVLSADVTPAFEDNFTTFDQTNWRVDSYDEGGDAFWSNDPADIADVLTASGGRLNFAIINRGSGGKSLTSAVFGNYNSQFNPGGSAHGQRYGYWEIAAAVDRYPGFEWEIDVIALPSFSAYMCMARVWTDGSNVQHVIQFTYDTPILIATDSSSGWDASLSHTYGLELTPTALRFYRDRALVGDFGNPGGGYITTESKYSKLWCNTNFASSAGVSVNPAGLPKYAHLDYYRFWPTRPF